MQPTFLITKFYSMRNFKVVDGDVDFEVVERVIKGRFTKKRFKTIHRAARERLGGKVPYCGCVYDCCGCLSSKGVSFDFRNGALVIQASRYYNY